MPTRTPAAHPKRTHTVSSCEQDTPFDVSANRVRLSPFARKKGRTTAEAMQLVQRATQRWHAGESVGFTYVSSLKSMGLIPRTDGRYRLGPKYCRA